MPTPLLLILCTAPDRETALKLSRSLLEQRLAACVNLSPPVTSVYHWQGRLEESEEILLLIKTTKQQYNNVEATLRAQHPYELPEIIAVPVEQGLDDYIDWVERCTKE
ncbi:MAG: divalent-cation tolerance protein CutA [Candidatus Thiodiazotropha sp. (ex Lucina aurantia)]|uniref:Divalent-cation tolerance protein CutA n=2 Tax=Candidatus Thiodiazotropha TaxID=1913444 RepID=A0A7Z0VMD2_9GAMM|nr:divalent-cation tolerance protein CutA [Candidatus Thiodiazotropha endolucinida]MBT3013144.1 divalent-cation tolerance protein CutA [Candidatus Thiodiazotropha sp. (ex Lucina pensylvanica)]MBT3017108.1 divalent-cation tolerance protein CutA [Candidatus Thiodiazotropha taylori]MBT3040662.1 divalent-cation tolerance protein CutA [Candidatus Thiodiazotropha sp. (ex Codakia orbicularis)]MBV2104573.1 divalent-cation tolerance protein CutA [Candidatus Thiodiazotropha sp. (ex Lucina aurantia)]MBT3